LRSAALDRKSSENNQRHSDGGSTPRQRGTPA
jgi:hypothetical protein